MASFSAQQDDHQQQQPFETTTATDNHQEQAFSDSWNEYWSRQPFPSGYTQSSITILACLITTIIFLIVVGNLLVCIAIFTEKSLKPTQNWFIASLAVSDMLLGLLVMPFSLARELMGFWIFGPLWCEIHEAIDVLLTTASINTLCLISLDRYWSITQAVSYLKKRTPRRGALMIAFVWFFSAAVSLPPLFGWKKQSPNIIANNSLTPPSASSSGPSSSASASAPPSSSSSSYRHPKKQHDTKSSSSPARWSDETNRDHLATPILGRHPLELDPSDSRRRRHLMAGDQEEPLVSIGAQPYLSNSFITSPPPQASLPINGNNKPTIQQTTDQTREYPSCQLSDDVGYVLYSALGSFYIPCAVMVFTYIKIFLAARSRARRAINKQSRAQQAANKRLAAQRAAGEQGSSPNKPPIGQDSPANNRHVDLPASKQMELMMKGKIVIVERKKSLAAAAACSMTLTSEGCVTMAESLTNTSTYTCSDLFKGDTSKRRNLVNTSSKFGDAAASGDPPTKVALCTDVLDQFELSDHRSSTLDQSTDCTITMSAAKQASASSLTSAVDSDDNSTLITMMNTTSKAQVPVTRFTIHNSESQTKSDMEKTKVDSLLEAISQVSSRNNEFIDEILSGDDKSIGDPSQVPNIVVERRATDVTILEPLECVLGDAKKLNKIPSNNQQPPNNTGNTNETCFMTIEEDSDMFEAQAGRTIMMTMLPPSERNQQQNTTSVCTNIACRRGQQQVTATRSASSYCGSSLTINDDDMDDCVDDELLTDDCNGYSVSCGLDQYCPGNAVCPHCQECQREHEEQMSPMTRNLPIGDLQNRTRQQQHLEQEPQASCPSGNEAEVQSMICDDNISLTEYRSNEDGSSIFGHDMLDATETSSSDRKRPNTNTPSGARKKSSIGFRLARLGSSVPQTTGALLALASNQQNQSNGTRNLKALRQNFFMKLNQLTTKSSTKLESKSKKSNKAISTGKSSAQSSGTSYEPSVDYATTSNVHSVEYHQETTLGEVDDPEHQTDFGSGHGGQTSLQLRNSNKSGESGHPTDDNSARPTGLNNQILDKNHERTLLLRDSLAGIEANNRRLHGTNSVMVSISNKSQKLDEHQGKRADGAQMNRSSTVMSSSAGTGNLGTNRAYLVSDNERHKRKLAKARERRATLILGLIMAAFICSWLPFFTFYVLRALCTVCIGYIPSWVVALIFWMGYCNSAINPIIYTIFNRDFRKAFRKILFKCL